MVIISGNKSQNLTKKTTEKNLPPKGGSEQASKQAEEEEEEYLSSIILAFRQLKTPILKAPRPSESFIFSFFLSFLRPKMYITHLASYADREGGRDICIYICDIPCRRWDRR
jgi:hypothetical protein